MNVFLAIVGYAVRGTVAPAVTSAPFKLLWVIRVLISVLRLLNDIMFRRVRDLVMSETSARPLPVVNVGLYITSCPTALLFFRGRGRSFA